MKKSMPSPTITVIRKDKSVEVRSAYWRVRHNLKVGGCWDSITFTKGTGRNLLTRPVSSRIRCLYPHPTSDASSPYFYEEKNDKNPTVAVEQGPRGPVVVVEGRYQLASPPAPGADVPQELPIRFRRRYEYRDWGLVTCELEVICEKDCDDVVEVVAADIYLRPGMTDAYVRDNPTCGEQSDLLGFGKWHSLASRQIVYTQRYVPMHVVCFEKGSEGLEFMPPSDLSQWDTNFCPQTGMGYYMVGPAWDDPAQTLISLSPYCLAYRRIPTKLRGTHRLTYHMGLPFIKDPATTSSKFFHSGVYSRWSSDEELERLARDGVKVLRFHNDYREDGPFWHDGQYPPFDEKGMAELRRTIDTAHRLGMKIVAYIDCKCIHPEAQDYPANYKAWRRELSPAAPDMHVWYGSGEFGQLMCMESSWLEFRKKSIDIILSDLPWDGLYLDWSVPHPCAHGDHVPGTLHSDQDAFLDFVFWCRKRVGPDGMLWTHLSGWPQVVLENLSDLALIYEDLAASARPNRPADFPVQCTFMPIAPRHLCGWGRPDSLEPRICAMVSLLQGHPPSPGAGGGSMDEWTSHFSLFDLDLLADGRFGAATSGAVQTGRPDVYGAIWQAPGKAMIYLANLSDRAARGTLKFDTGLILGKARKPGPAQVSICAPRGVPKVTEMSAAALARRGIPYALKPWSAAMVRVTL